MRKFLFLTLFSLFTPGLPAAPHYDQIDEHARNAPQNLDRDLDKLTAYLVRPAETDAEKVRAFYVWIAEHIDYDVSLFKRYRPGISLNITPEDVLKQGKAVCQGYSDLMIAMCTRVGIEARLVPGYSKGFGNENRTDFSNADHAWNAVKIDGKWQLLDATWGAGGLDENMNYVPKFNEKYFLADPKEFIKDHMPLYPMWQLLDCPVSMQAFALGGQALDQELADPSGDCIRFSEQISRFDQMEEAEQDLALARMAYAFNPDNHVVMARGYMDYAHYLMSGINRQLRSREEIEAAVSVQENALSYLRQAENVLDKVKGKAADREKEFVRQNIRNSEQNLRAMKKILQG